MKDELDKLFNEREERKQEMTKLQEEEKSKHQLFREHVIEIIKSTFLPVLNEFKSELESRGHDFKISQSLENASYPSVGISFKLVDDDPKGNYVSPSTLSFRTTVSEDKFEVNREIWWAKGKEEMSSKNFRMIEKIDSDWIRSQVIDFVKSVINRN